MHFDWDERKNVENIHKHGFDFAHAHQVFQRPVLRMLDERKDYGEDRWIGIGMLDSIRIVVVVFTELDRNRIRIISMRKALAYERQQYIKAFRDEFGAV